MKQCFIKTTDEETAKKLKEIGLICVGEESNSWTFINDDKIKFDNMKKVSFTNILNM